MAADLTVHVNLNTSSPEAVQAALEGIAKLNPTMSTGTALAGSPERHAEISAGSYERGWAAGIHRSKVVLIEQFHALIDLYEREGDQAVLDAIEEAANNELDRK